MAKKVGEGAVSAKLIALRGGNAGVAGIAALSSHSSLSKWRRRTTYLPVQHEVTIGFFQLARHAPVSCRRTLFDGIVVLSALTDNFVAE